MNVNNPPETKNTKSWIELAMFPAEYFSEILPLNSNEFICVPQNYENCHSDGIYKYDIKQNVWTKIIKYGTNFQSSFHSATIDNTKHSIYLYGIESTLFHFDLQTMTLKSKISTKDTHDLGDHPRLFWIDNKLHLVGGADNSKHFTWNNENKQFEEMHNFEQFANGLMYHVMLKSNTKNSILMFGGQGRDGSLSDSVYEFSSNTTKWHKCAMSLPVQMCASGIVSTSNDEYVFIFGGYSCLWFEYTDDIFIYNTKSNEWFECNIQTPGESWYQAIMINDKCKDNLATFGFVRENYKQNMFPEYLCQLIGQWFCTEVIYILRVFTGEHFKINVDVLLEQMEKWESDDESESESE